MTEQDGPRYAERMFPAPADHGIALPDRAVATVRSGTDTAASGEYQNELWYQGGGRIGEKAVESIVVYPPTRGVRTQGDPFEPVKIGILIDMDIGQLLADWIDPTILAIEDALNEGIYDRPVEIFTVDARGLPRENYLKVRKGYQRLVDEGCVVVIGPMISDNSVNLRETVNATGVACLGWTGATRFFGEYCFTVANGDIPTEGEIAANWCFQNGYARSASSGSRVPPASLTPTTSAPPRGSTAWRSSRRSRSARTRATSSGTWPPCAPRAPRRSSTWATATRPSTSPRPSRRWTGTRPASWAPPSCSIPTPTPGPRAWRAGTASTSSARTAPTPTTRRCLSASRPGSAASPATSSWPCPTTRPGRRSSASPTRASPRPRRSRPGSRGSSGCPAPTAARAATSPSREYDHRGYKGDFLTIRELRGGELHFRGYYRPTWPSNTRSPLLKQSEA